MKQWLSTPAAILYLMTGDWERAAAIDNYDPDQRPFCCALALTRVTFSAAVSRRELTASLATMFDRDRPYEVGEAWLSQLLRQGEARARARRVMSDDFADIDPADFPNLAPRGNDLVRAGTEIVAWYGVAVSGADLEAARNALQPGLAPGSSAVAESAVAAADVAVYRTGLPGKPTSWHLLEMECRRRYAAGECHPKVAEWARVLIAWLRSAHPSAPPPTEKTARNKLSPLLRELKADRPR